MSKHIRTLTPSQFTKIYPVLAVQPTEAIAAARSRTGADILINGGLFDMSGGATACGLKIDGKWIKKCADVYGLATGGNKVHAVYLNSTGETTWANFMQCYCTLVLNGQIKINTTAANVMRERRGRTAIGTKMDGSVVVYVCQDGTDALTGPELAEKMLDLGCTYALNFDGGGSSAYIGPDATLNTSRKLDSFIAIELKKEDKPMGIKTYYKSSMGDQSITPHFRVKEFACRDGTDQMLIDSTLAAVLEDIRTSCGGKPVVINSGYRTPAYNTKAGGAPNSYHLSGMAADITVAGADTLTVCKAAEAALKKRGIAGGIGRYIGQGFVHADTRAVRSRFQQDKSGQAVYNVSGWDGTQAAKQPTIRRGAKGEAVKSLQKALGGLTADGDFGGKTEAAVLAFQRGKGLTADGIVGPKTWGKLGQ